MLLDVVHVVVELERELFHRVDARKEDVAQLALLALSQVDQPERHVVIVLQQARVQP